MVPGASATPLPRIRWRHSNEGPATKGRRGESAAAVDRMNSERDDHGGMQQALMRLLCRDNAGLPVNVLAERLNMSRNAVRRDLSALERDRLITKRNIQAAGRRPEQLYVLTERGAETFPRQYSWIADLLPRLIETEIGGAAAGAKIAAMGRAVGGRSQIAWARRPT